MRVYLSNIRSQWPVDRQEKLLDEGAPGWREASIYRDVLSRAAIRRQAALPERDGTLLRSTRRVCADDVYVASLSVIAWTPTDLIAVLMRLAARHERLVALAEDVTVEPANADVDAVRQAFASAVRRFSRHGVTGGEASGARRSADAKAKIEAMRPYWPMPSEEYPTAALCRQYGISRPTAILYLGSRKEAQRARLASLETAERNRRRKERAKS